MESRPGKELIRGLGWANPGASPDYFAALAEKPSSFPLSNLLGSAAFALRILANGDVLVGDTDRVLRLDATGNVMQAYLPNTGGELFALKSIQMGRLFKLETMQPEYFIHVDVPTSAVLGGNRPEIVHCYTTTSEALHEEPKRESAHQSTTTPICRAPLCSMRRTVIPAQSKK